MTAATYWRLYITANTGGGYYSLIAGIKFLSTGNGELVEVPAVNGTPFASSELNGACVAANAFDNDANTFWNSTGDNPPYWIGYQFATPQSIQGVRITLDNLQRSPLSFKLQSSNDNTTWDDILSVSNAGWTNGTQTKTFWITPGNVATPRFSSQLQNTRLPYLTDLANTIRSALAGGIMDIYYCLPANKPATLLTAIGQNHTKIASFTLPSPAGTVTDNVFTFGAIDPATVLVNVPNPVGYSFFARLSAANYNYSVMDLDVGPNGSGAAILLDNMVFTQGQSLSISSIVVTE